MKTDNQGGKRQIKDLTLRELDMIYSLTRVGDWSYTDIARRYGILESDVRKVVEGYTELRRAAEKKLSDEGLRQDPSPQLAKKKPRKRRSDARYRSAAERQAAYRARLKERRRAGMQLPSPAPVTDQGSPPDQQFSVTAADIRRQPFN